MWILPSRSRPHNLARLIDAWMGAKTPVWLRLDEDDPLLDACLALSRPDGWHVEIGERLPLSCIYNEIGLDLPWYGFIADDVVPETPGWDVRLIEVAGNDGMALPAGGHGGAPHFVLGGDLVSSLGWVSLPGLDRTYIDTVWQDIATWRGVLREVPEVVLAHHHFSNGKALMDATYRKRHKQRDRRLYEQWRATMTDIQGSRMGSRMTRL